MTDARAAAIEAALRWAGNAVFRLRAAGDMSSRDYAQAAIDAYLTRMAEAGWVMVRDVGTRPPGETAGQALINTGWDACRAAMLGKGE